MWEYRTKIIKVIDGDTLWLDIDLGFEVDTRPHVRLFGINTPEIHGVKKESEEFGRGMIAKNYVYEWALGAVVNLFEAPALIQDVELIIRSHDGHKLKKGKYGRWLGEIFHALPGTNGEAIDPSKPSLNIALLKSGNAESYPGSDSLHVPE